MSLPERSLMAVAQRPFSLAYRAALTTDPESRATPADAFRRARAMWLSGQRVDMVALAAALGVSRPTLYKWCGDRDQLLTDVIWSISEAIFDRALHQTRRLEGAERALAILCTFLDTIATSDALQGYVRNETHAAMRLLTTRGGYQDRLVDKVAGFLRDEAERGRLRLTAEPHLIAYAIVRVSESFLYNDAIAAVDPHIADAVEIVRLIIA